MKSENNIQTPRQGKATTGIIFLLLGVFMLAKTTGLAADIPDWIISWPMLLIIIGVLSGINHKFRRPGAYFMIAIGGVFLAERIIPGVQSHDLIFPVILLALGLHLIFGKKLCNKAAVHN
ncbi:hypothetical protein BDE36_0592 [Arcticibacter tournemirensis]|uniref:LiaF transmembrane domain-containing protein n=1 Tax=Arcticibacter tournemirensis TaxID=699437 RepID=A0A5M9H441_9SPHI|nr:DUF5668 domain-containing protein [Arcticibacter tournemirensis]KAA8481696.1 hypothetical protein F1649_14275 [Arcticibacter tournemirensis]TQM48901.1 hypothetical protein BDE36_0592 [Arcticibacter tournemirensis]